MDIKLYKVEPATQLPGNKYWIKSVPIFAEIERTVQLPNGETIYRNYNEEWIQKTVQNHLKEQNGNKHLLPLKIGHSVPGKEVIRQSAGLLKIVGCDYTVYNGEPKLTIFGDLLVSENVYHGMQNLEYPGASVEIWRPDDFRISNCALLPDQDSEFKFPPIIPEDVAKQFMECVPVNEEEFKLCIFSEFREDNMDRTYKGKGQKQFASAFRYEVDQQKKSKKNSEESTKAANSHYDKMSKKGGQSKNNMAVSHALDGRAELAQKDYNSKKDWTNREAFKNGKKFEEDMDENEELQEEAIEQNDESTPEGEGGSIDDQIVSCLEELSEDQKAELLEKLMELKGNESTEEKEEGPVMFSEQIQRLTHEHFEETLPKEVVLQMFSEMAGEIRSLRRERELDKTKKKISRTVNGLSQSQAIAAKAYQFSEMYGDEVGLEFASAMAQLGPKDPIYIEETESRLPQEYEEMINQFSEIPNVEGEILKLDAQYENSASKTNGMSKERFISSNLNSIKLSLKR